MRVSNSPGIGTVFALKAAQALSVYTSVPSGDSQRWIALVASTGGSGGHARQQHAGDECGEQ